MDLGFAGMTYDNDSINNSSPNDFNPCFMVLTLVTVVLDRLWEALVTVNIPAMKIRYAESI
jgi:hypothetical protein